MQEQPMGLFANLWLESMDDLLLAGLEELFDAERRLANAFPRMWEAASDSGLKQAFKDHLHKTQRHVARLERAFGLLGQRPTGKTCEAMKGLIAHGEEIISADGEAEIRDIALIEAAQRVAYYEIAAYDSARKFAQQLGRPDLAALLQETLDEERAADEKLTQIAESAVSRNRYSYA
jgi:ferritin-like metal-binding protein YciE